MRMPPSLRNPAILRPVDVLPPQCLDADELAKQLIALSRVLQNRVMAEEMTEMELTARSGVSVESALGPFVTLADDFYSAGRAFTEFEYDFFHRNTLPLIGYGGSRPSLIFMCQNTDRIQSLLRMIDQRLAGLAAEFRRSFSIYATDAQRLRFLTPAPGQPMPRGTAPGPGLRGATVAEQTALAMVRTFRQQLSMIAGLMREALQEIIPVGIRRALVRLPI
jgi:hypothetical protein